MPIDVMSQPTPPLERIDRTPARPVPDARQVAAAAELLAGADSVVMILGGGAVDAGAQALSVADRCDAAIGVTINGKGTVPGSHPRCLGATLSFSPVYELIRDADVTLAVGTEFSELDWWGLSGPRELRGKLIRIDIDPAQLDRSHSADVAIAADAGAALGAIAERLGELERTGAGGAQERVARALAQLELPVELTDHRPLLDVLDQALPADRIVAADSTQPAYAANHLMPAEHARSWMMPVGFGTLGCALPLAIGAKVAAPERAVVCLAGDGGVLFTLSELATARDLGLGLPVVIWNNDGYGEIADSMKHAGFGPIAIDASPHDLPAIARGFGCAALSTRSLDEAATEIAAALTRSAPTLIEVRP